MAEGGPRRRGREQEGEAGGGGELQLTGYSKSYRRYRYFLRPVSFKPLRAALSHASPTKSLGGETYEKCGPGS